MPPTSNKYAAVNDKSFGNPYVRLDLQPAHVSNVDNNTVLPQSDLMVFSYTPKHHVHYTVEEFSMTRFGTYRKRRDDTLLKCTQREAANRRMRVDAHTSDANNIHPQVTEAGHSTDANSINTLQRNLPNSSSTMYPDPNIADLETLRTLTAQQRQAVVNHNQRCFLCELMSLLSSCNCRGNIVPLSYLNSGITQ
ncbi:hypothetical protein KIN20_017318 [Parelaphostrongylus tenuis]|uniref:Uncharacterized protein n=1 Tax=Parelaphostrongylus tenuis TaxID=148309 RepID=A0AAD5QQN1_PARTN|nr:hypothetical protein KIN20_017318 [Parelaphostrongylus tenuis]